MNTPAHPPHLPLPITHPLVVSLRVLCVFVVSSLPACSTTDLNAVANKLRTENIQQKEQIAKLQDAVLNRDATIRDLQQHFADNNPPLPTLPPDRLAQLFTASRLQIQSQSDWEDLGNNHHGFRVFLRTFTADDQIAPAAGTLTIEAFQLPPSPAPTATPAQLPNPTRLGTWTFTPAEMKKSWYTGLGLNHFAFSCPCAEPPTSPSIVLRATLRDALTGQTLLAQIDKKISPSALTTTRAAASK